MLFVDSLYLQMTWSYLWALATPLVLWAAARLPIEKNSWLSSSLLHIPISILLSVFLTALGHIALWLYWSYPAGKPFSFPYLTRFIIGNFSEGIGIYLLIALTFYAYHYYRRYREGQLKLFSSKPSYHTHSCRPCKMQLHPHFLFNTLHSISALLTKDVEAARKMITRLGDFLRLTLENSGSQEVTLKQEMEFLTCYLEIERIRFQNRLVTRMDLGDKTLDAKVPNLILQPIVENAIRYGIAPRSTRVLLEIEAKQLNGKLRIQVRDNGPGLPNIESQNQVKKGLGLANTETR